MSYINVVNYQIKLMHIKYDIVWEFLVAHESY